MQILKKLFIAVLLVTFVLFVGLSVFLSRNGKALLEEKLSEALNEKVVVREAHVIFPLGIRFDDVQVKDMLAAKTVRMKIGIPIFFGGQFNISKASLIDPVFFVSRKADQKIIWGVTGGAVKVGLADPVPARKPVRERTVAHGILIDFLEIENGTVVYVDETDRTRINVRDVDLKALMVSVPPRDIKSKFDFSARIANDDVPFSGHRVEAQGMINIAALDMDATIKVIDPDGSSGISAQLKSVKNDMIVKGKVDVGRFVTGVQTKGAKESSWEGLLANALESSGVEIGIDFTCQTRMDQFNCNKLSMSGNVVQHEKPAGP